jgi:hypothetical protein
MPRLKLTRKAQQQVIGGIRTGADLALCAKALGISASTISKLVARDPRFADEVREAREFANDVVEKRLFDRTKISDTACIFWLKNRRPQNWRDRSALELTGRDGGPILTSTAKEALRAKLLR